MGVTASSASNPGRRGPRAKVALGAALLTLASVLPAATVTATAATASSTAAMAGGARAGGARTGDVRTGGARAGGARAAAVPGRDAAALSRWARLTGVLADREVRGGAELLVWPAYVSTAMYNAVVGIEGRYAPYGRPAPGPRGASSEAAAVAAAHRVLLHYFPKAADNLSTAYAASLEKVPDGPAEDRGVAYGEYTADQVIAQRQNDGRGRDVLFDKEPEPGVWRPTPPDFQPFGNAWMARLRPWLLESPQQFRPGPPPALGSERYVRELEEVREYGSRTGSRRTPRQTETALFFDQTNVQGAVADHAARHRLDIVDTARMYAAVDTTQADAVIAAWDAKLHYGTWRPVTAIRHADQDDSPATEPDRNWQPLLATPAHPDYLSGHATTVGALSGTMTELLGHPRIDLNVHSLGNGTTRHYENADEFDRDVIDARVLSGIHTRTADVVGNAVGHRIAEWALDRYFRPLSER